MPEDADWSLATWEGNRKRQHEEFHALPLREKVKILEQLDELTRALRRPPGQPSPGAEGD